MNKAFANIARLMVLLLASTLSTAFAQGYTYRYVNDEGVQVLGNSIPPQYVHKGYEVLSPMGRVIQVVEPAPPPEEIAAERALAELKVKYEHLAKRYSSVRDIEAAKQRKLIDVEAGLVLANSNVRSVQKEIDQVMSQAAEHERAGREVPKSILYALKVLNEKMDATKATRDARLADKEAIANRFEDDKLLFINGVKAFDPESFAEKGTLGEESNDDKPDSQSPPSGATSPSSDDASNS